MNLFTRIEEALATMPNGWCTVPKAQALAAVVLAQRPSIAVEIGVFGGRSLIPVAMAMQEVGCGIIYGIDPWDAKASEEGQVGENAKWWGKLINHDFIYNTFMADVTRLGVSDFCHIVRKRSDDVTPPENMGFLHLDGNHGPQALNDAQRFAPNVKRGGYCFMDDIGWVGGHVSKACNYIQSIGFVELYRMDTGAMYQRL